MRTKIKKLPISLIRHGVMLCALLLGMKPALATNLSIHLLGVPALTRESVSYTCDAAGGKIGLPSGKFEVEYINGGGNSLAVVPISGNALIFANVSSASGARYRAQQYTWWEAKGEATLYANSINGKLTSSCTRAR